MTDIYGYKDMIRKQQVFYKTGATRDVDFRIAMLKRLHKAVIDNEAKIAAALKADLGKSLHEVLTTEIGQITSEIKYLIKHIRQYTGKKWQATNLINIPSNSFVLREPYGVVLVMGPWNYPFQLIMAPLAAAMASGNCVVVKPSEISSHTAQVIEAILRENFNDNYIKVVQGAIDETKALLDERFDKIFFTGSPKVGHIVMEKAAKHLTPVVLELGGKSPCIVDKTSQLDVAMKRLIFGKATNAGQTCIAPDYVLVHEDLAEDFFASFAKVAGRLFGHKYEFNDDFGRIINESNFDRLIAYLQDGHVIYGGGHNREHLSIDLTLIEVTDLERPIMTEEIFGPILPIIRYKDLNEAIEIIERNPDPLALYVFSKDSKMIDTLLEKVPFGGGCINDTLMHLTNDNLPFGGRGTSGMGRYHGKYSFEAFTHEKAVLHSRMFFDLMIKYPPYKEKRAKLIRRLLY